MNLDIVVLGLSITSSWGNGHATTYRGLIRELDKRGHRVLFLERDVPWYAGNRDMPEPPYCRTELYTSLEELKERFAKDVRDADLVIAGSYLPEGIAVCQWVTETARGITAFYDIDTPVTLSRLENGGLEYLSRALVPKFDLYLSFTGGPTLRRLESEFGAQRARGLYCSVDPSAYYPVDLPLRWDMGYLGTYSSDRQPTLERLMLQPARQLVDQRFIVAGPQYPPDVAWPANVERETHLSPALHRDFYNAQRFTLNVTRDDMVRAGYSPSVRLFEASACGTPIISDWWDGLDTILTPGEEILIARSPEESRRYLTTVSEAERRRIGERARRRVLALHTAEHRAVELEGYVEEVAAARVSATKS